ncbi:hypothetical protein C7T94_06140 [Pedobacter yulinensis]|uniref:FecR protein domain-containing protein n=1 Tax=Pedobacter yulinensis TaxID=2126353 RepID=A0A2T3HPB5_9SPHI|nr:FecR domain-containing protein [Pedobacter yulinensis]PST84295.1 hypothetical protein C7T94_06140 [Pedobacter yulinensis]
MTENQAKELLRKYLSGEATPAEASHVEQWFRQLETDKPGPSIDQKQAIRQQVFVSLQQAMTKGTSKPRLAGRWWLRAAAALLIGSAVFGAYQFLQPSSQSLMTAARRTQNEQPDTLRLADGTQVELGTRGRIDYAASTKKIRRIRLSQGEAFFNVKHDEQRPFIVDAGSGLSIKVLGTSFTVRNHANDGAAQVEVSTGKVAVRKNGRLIGILTRGQRLSYDHKTERATVVQLREVRSIMLSFSASSLGNVLRELEYAYNIRITLADTRLSQLKCTANFSSAQAPEDILDILCRLHHISFKTGSDPASFEIYP